jgi:hypothetical protein
MNADYCSARCSLKIPRKCMYLYDNLNCTTLKRMESTMITFLNLTLKSLGISHFQAEYQQSIQTPGLAKYKYFGPHLNIKPIRI